MRVGRIQIDSRHVTKRILLLLTVVILPHQRVATHDVHELSSLCVTAAEDDRLPTRGGHALQFDGRGGAPAGEVDDRHLLERHRLPAQREPAVHIIGCLRARRGQLAASPFPVVQDKRRLIRRERVDADGGDNRDR